MAEGELVLRARDWADEAIIGGAPDGTAVVDLWLRASIAGARRPRRRSGM